ncbi:hypothetical protein [Daejeonia sp. YH14]|uniref:hypothetical protein n=1 Tax=Daejeonia sp. YH14 TaxID=3439042 RepID=UPI003F495873
MKKIFFLLVLLACSLVHAQYLVEDMDENQSPDESGSAKIEFNMNQHLEFFRLKCNQPVYAQFPGGEEAFKKKLFKNMNAYIDDNLYAVNGTFTFLFGIDKKGDIKDFGLLPKVQNSDMLYRDLNYVVRKLKEKWTPASCNGIPVDSKVRLKVNFSTENFDR